MPDQIQSQRVVSQGGLNTLNNYLTLSTDSPGAAVRLQNFESSLSGGYRQVNGYRPYSETFKEVDSAGAEGPILGVWVFYNTSTREYETIAARKTNAIDEYKFYYFDQTLGWVAYTTGLTFDSENVTGQILVRRVRAETFNHGDGNKIIFVDGVNHATVYDGTTWYSLTSAGTGGTGSPGGDQILDAPSVVTSFKNYILISGDESLPGVIAHCAPSDVFNWEASAGGGQLIYGFDVVQIKPFRDACFAFGKTSIKKIIPSGDPGVTFTMEDVTNNIGCIARDSVLEIGGNLIFLSQDGIRPIAGTERIGDVELNLLSQNIQDLIDGAQINFDLTYVNGIVIRGKTQFRYFLSNDAYPQIDGYGLIGCMRRLGDSSFWEFGELIGIRASASWSGIVGTTEVVLHGDYDGVVYQQERGGTFNGNPIIAIYTTPYLDMGDTELRKTIREINVFIKAEGTFDLNIGVRFDWGSQYAQNPANYVGQINGAAVYDDPTTIYDDPSTVYGGLARSVYEQPIQGSCFSVQYIFSSSGSPAPYTIHGFVHEFSTKGRQ